MCGIEKEVRVTVQNQIGSFDQWSVAIVTVKYRNGVAKWREAVICHSLQ